MSFEALLLILASAGLLAALSASRERLVVVAVAGYAAVLMWLLRTDMDLLLRGLAIAIVLGAAAVGRRLHHQMQVPPDTDGPARHKSSQEMTTNPSLGRRRLP